MTPSTTARSNDRLHDARVNPPNVGLLRWTSVSLVVVEGLLLASAWGRGDLVQVLLALFAVRVVANLSVLAWMSRTGRTTLGLCLAMGCNMILTTLEARLLAWNLLSWLHVLCQVVFLNGLEEQDQRVQHRLAISLFLPVCAAWAVHDGADPRSVGVVCVMACLLYGYGEASHQMLLKALEDSRGGYQRLQGMQARLVEQEKLSSLGLLAAGVAHEINNPMAFVTSNLRELSRELASQPPLPAALREYVDEVLPETLDGVRRVNSIVADLRRFARGDVETPVEFELNSEVTSAIRLSRGEQKDQRRLEVELGELPSLLGQPRQICQVALNLLVNALQALPPQGGVVRVSTRVERDEVVLEVRDTGVGMSAEVLKSLFQPFFTTKPVGEGTGLGLAVAYGIITGHGGRIDVESAPGVGTCITVRLPAPARPRSSARSAPLTSRAAAQLGS